MPKTSNEGRSYAGLVDVSGADTLVPEWAPVDSVADGVAEDVVAEPADVSRETKPVRKDSKAGARKSND